MSFGACVVSGRGRLDTMPLGPGAGAEGYVHPVGPRCDKAADAARPPVPPVPRTMRAKPKASSRGYIARASRREDPHVEICDRSVTPISQCSETRRPREESPFAHARKHSLARERDERNNQAFEMGPARRNAEERNDYRLFQRAGSCPPSRDVADGGDGEFPIGKPLGRRPGRASPCDDVENQDPMRQHARRSNLQRERVAADQGLEYGTPECKPISVAPLPAAVPSHARRNMLAGENAVADKGSQMYNAAEAQTFGRIMGRRDGSAPPAVRNGHDTGDEIRHGRKNLLARGATGAYEGATASRVMGL